MSTVSVRYIVNDVDEADRVLLRSTRFRRGDASGSSLRHALPGRPPPLAQRGGSTGRSRRRLPGHARWPGLEPGGWNRFTLEVPDLATAVATLRKAGPQFRNDIVTGVGGKQILLEDLSGNPIELFEPTIPEAKLSSQA